MKKEEMRERDDLIAQNIELKLQNEEQKEKNSALIEILNELAEANIYLLSKRQKATSEDHDRILRHERVNLKQQRQEILDKQRTAANKFLLKENERLTKASTELAESNIYLLSKWQKEKKHVPKQGQWFLSLLFAVLFGVAGFFLPTSPIEIFGFVVHGNLFQLFSVFLILVLVAVPFVLPAISDLLKIWRDEKK